MKKFFSTIRMEIIYISRGYSNVFKSILSQYLISIPLKPTEIRNVFCLFWCTVGIEIDH